VKKYTEQAKLIYGNRYWQITYESFAKLLKDELVMDDYWILDCIYVKKQ
jgi:hypothetical protein